MRENKDLFSQTVRISLPPGHTGDAKAEPSPPKGRPAFTPQDDVDVRWLAARGPGLEQLFQSVYDGAILTDPEGLILAANSRMLEFLGCKRNELLGMNVTQVIYGADADLLRTIAANLENQRFTVLEAYCQRKDGNYFPSEIAVSRLRLDGSFSLCFFIRDITSRKQAEEEQRRLDERVRQAQKLESLGVLAGGMAHNFNNLLVSVLGNADLALSEMAQDAPQRPLLEEIRRWGQRAAELARLMLAYSGKGRFVIQSVDLSELLENLLPLARASATDNIEIESQLATDLPPVEVDPDQIHQAVMNLIVNAVEAIGQGHGVITLRTGVLEATERDLMTDSVTADPLPAGTYVFFEVSDTGEGIDESILGKLFEPFFSTKFTGRGLGLAAALGIVRGHRGAIQVWSEPKHGSTFRVLLPAAAKPAVAPPSSKAPAPAAGGKGTVLLVDDEEGVRKVAQTMLERGGYRVLTACDGQEGLEVFAKNADEINLVLLDMIMPRLSGREALREMQALRPDIPVVVITGYSEEEATMRFAGLKIAGLLLKPFQTSMLLAAVREALPQP